MGNRIDAFQIKLEFDDEGQVNKVSYEDAAGCGREDEFDNLHTVGELVAHHLEHYRDHHDRTPADLLQCTSTVRIASATFAGAIRPGTRIRCALKNNHTEQHEYRIDGMVP